MAWTYDRLYLKSPDYKAFTALVSEACSGGDLMSASGADDVLTSGVVQWGDLKVCRGITVDDDRNCVGVALQNTAQSGALAVITDGYLVLNSGSDTTNNGVTPGYKIMPVSTMDGVVDCWDSKTSGCKAIGRAITGASTGAKGVFCKLDV